MDARVVDFISIRGKLFVLDRSKYFETRELQAQGKSAAASKKINCSVLLHRLI